MIRFCLPLLAVSLCAGCGYRFGNHSPDGIRTVSLGAIAVDGIKGEPHLAQWTSEKIRNAIATDNTLTLVDGAGADAQLEVRVARLRSVPAGQAKLSSDDPDQQLYTTSIWRAEIILEFRLAATGKKAAKAPWKRVTGSAEYGDLIDITVMRKDAVRQALINASRKMVRDMLDTW